MQRNSHEESCYDEVCDLCCTDCRWLLIALLVGVIAGISTGGNSSFEDGSIKQFDGVAFALGVGGVIGLTVLILCMTAIVGSCVSSRPNPVHAGLFLDPGLSRRAIGELDAYVAFESPTSVNTV